MNLFTALWSQLGDTPRLLLKGATGMASSAWTYAMGTDQLVNLEQWFRVVSGAIGLLVGLATLIGIVWQLRDKWRGKK